MYHEINVGGLEWAYWSRKSPACLKRPPRERVEFDIAKDGGYKTTKVESKMLNKEKSNQIGAKWYSTCCCNSRSELCISVINHQLRFSFSSRLTFGSVLWTRLEQENIPSAILVDTVVVMQTAFKSSKYHSSLGIGVYLFQGLLSSVFSIL